MTLVDRDDICWNEGKLFPVNVGFLQNPKSTSDSCYRVRLRQMVKLDVDKLLLDPSHNTEKPVLVSMLRRNMTLAPSAK